MPEKFLCFRCEQRRTAKQFPNYNPSSQCDHLVNTCKDCLKQWVNAQIDGTNFAVGGKGGKAFGIRCLE
jgi:hypothetical protein